MTSENKNEKFSKPFVDVVDLADDISKGYESFRAKEGHKYETRLDTSRSCAVNVIDRTQNKWVVRFDHPHRGTNYDHININPAISGVADPHIKLPPGGLKVAKGATTVLRGANKVVLPLAVALDTYQTGVAIEKDIENKTTRNTVETVAEVTGGWVGGLGGAAGGAALGTAIFPGVGTIIGAVAGGIAGGIGGSVSASAIANEIGDSVDYDIITIICENCKSKFKWRKYEEKEPECPYCKKRAKNLY